MPVRDLSRSVNIKTKLSQIIFKKALYNHLKRKNNKLFFEKEQNVWKNFWSTKYWKLKHRYCYKMKNLWYAIRYKKENFFGSAEVPRTVTAWTLFSQIYTLLFYALCPFFWMNSWNLVKLTLVIKIKMALLFCTLSLVESFDNKK